MSKMKNYAVEKIQSHDGNKTKQSQVGDNHLHHCRNQHIRYHVARYMRDNGVASKYDLGSIINR